MRILEPVSSRTLSVTLCAVVFMCALPAGAFSAGEMDLHAFGISPDGKRIAYPVPGYDEYGDPATVLWTAGIDGSRKKQVASLPCTWNVQWLDANRIACTDYDMNEIPIFQVDSGEQTTASLTDAFQWAQPSISPDGHYVAFNAVKQEPREAGVWLLDVATDKIKQLSSEAVKSYVAWSPDSKRIVFGVGAYQAHYDIQIIDVVSGEVTDTGLDGVGVEFSPDGKSIAYTGKIVRGGSWYLGVPLDGRILVTNLQSKETIPVSPAAYNLYDEPSKSWEIRGGSYPKWSPDGKMIAYRKQHKITENRDTKLDTDEIWVADTDGSGLRKIRDKWAPYVWSPDSKSLLINGENGIDWVGVDKDNEHRVVAWDAVPPQPDKMPEGSAQADGAMVDYKGVKPAYAKALLAVAAEARRIYTDQFKFDMPAKVELHVTKDPNAQARLWTDGESAMMLTVKSNADLAPPRKSGIFNIFGICHELGHIAMYRSMTMLGLPSGVGEGWAYYAGSVVVDKVGRKFGKDLWPEPYNYMDIEGTARLARQSKDPDAAKEPASRAALVFYAADRKYGTDKVMAAMKSALEGKPQGKDVMPRFAAALAEVTGDQSAASLIPVEMLSSVIDWQVAGREITGKTVEGVIREKDGTGITLRYDDGSSEGSHSTTGAGHAVVFRTQPGEWAIDSVSMYGSRYGDSEPPKEDFSIFICDKDFSIIKEIRKPYSLLERGNAKWYKLDFEPVKVPEAFYVCIYFSPTYHKGFYMNFDKSVAKSHSRSALPWTFVHDVEDKFDWMIRPHLVEANR